TGSRTASKRRSSVWKSRAAGAAIVLTVLLAVWTVYPVLRLQYQQQREVRSLETELADLKVRNEDLREQVEQLKTPEGVERVARESLGLVKPGEQAYVVTGSGSVEASSAATSEAAAEPFLQSVFDLLFGLH
ncbi:MAG TPA: septum formation initiator family protein, partial [Coriobacteriia bacterium]|nr:septum formation initiator family protein [Coriobacteriia bacterium]